MNLMMLLEMAAEGLRRPGGTRVTLEGGLTYRELFARAGAAANPLPATTRATPWCCATSRVPAVPISLFGAAWAGMPYIPLNYRLPDDDLCARWPNAARPGVAVADDAGADRLGTGRMV